jgi:multidrug resistance efflux pump
MASYGRHFTAFGRVLFVGLLVMAGAASAQTADKKAVGALATLQPKSGMIQLVGKSGLGIAALAVSVGQQISKGDLIAVYDNHENLAIQARLIEAEIKELEGNHRYDEAAQDLRIAGANDALKQAIANFDRYHQLSQNARVDAVLEERKAAVESARRALRMAQADKERLATSHTLALAKANIRLDLARSAVTQAELRAPISGTIMSVLKNVGEASDGPIVTLADLTHMQAVSDVYEGDLARVKVGQSAEVKANALQEVLTGKVVLVGRQVKAESRVASVWIDLNDSAVASRYIGMEVNVSILP